MPYCSLSFEDLSAEQAASLIAVANTFGSPPTQYLPGWTPEGFTSVGGGVAPPNQLATRSNLQEDAFPPSKYLVETKPPTQAHQSTVQGQPVPGPAPARPPQPRKVKAEKPVTASVSPHPIGGPVVLPLTLDELKRRAMLFMDDPTCGGELFAKRLAEFAKVDGSPVKRISDLPVEMYDTFLHRLVPELRMSQTETSGGNLLD